jgi:FkbM family methyltransferase
MKNNFYIHGTSELVDLQQDAEIIREGWANRFNSKHPESVAYYEIYNRQDYFKGDCVILPGDIVVDCGGNIGIFSALAYDMGASRVLSFEPFIDNFELNKKNNPNIQVFNLAVSNKSNENMELLYTATGNGGHTIISSEYDREPGHFQHKNLFVKTITLDDIISQNFIEHIDFLKIDTEGAELMILEGLSDANLDKIRCISLEYHHAVFNFDENIYDKFQRKFLSRGFNTFTWILDNYTRMLYVCKGDVFKDNPLHNHK